MWLQCGGSFVSVDVDGAGRVLGFRVGTAMEQGPKNTNVSIRGMPAVDSLQSCIEVVLTRGGDGEKDM